MRVDAAREAVTDLERWLAESGELDLVPGEAGALTLPGGEHLTLLQHARLVESQRDGRETRFQATPAPLADAIGWMTDVGAPWDDRLAALGKTVSTPASADRRG